MSVRTSAVAVRRVSRFTVGALLLAVGLGSTVRADILGVAPTGSLGVFQVKDLASTSKKAGDLFTKLGIAGMKPELTDPLGALKTELKITKGIKEDGEFGVILLPAAAWPAEAEAKNEPAVVMLISVSSYDDFVANLEGATKDGDITVFETDGKQHFVRKWGDYAAFAATKEYLATPGGGVKVNDAAKKEFSTKDAVFWANIPAIKEAFGAKLADKKAKAFEEMDAKLSGDEKMAKYAPTIKVIAGQFFSAAETFLNESQGATISWNLTDAGVNSTVATEFAPESYLGTWTKSLKGAKKSFTEGLPGGSYLFYGGMALEGDAVAKLFTDFAGPVVAEAVKIEGVGSEAQKAYDAMLSMVKSTKLTNVGLMAPKGGLGQESLFQYAYYVKADAKTYLESARTFGEGYAKLLSGLQGSDAMPFTMTYKAANKTVDGVTFDTLEAALDPNPKTPEAAQMAQMMSMMYGPNGLSSNFGKIDDNTVIMYLGLPDAAVSKLIASAKAGSDDLGKMANLKATAKELPAESVGQFYVALDEIARTAANAAQQFGLPVKLQLPDNLPPIGMAIDADGTVLRFDSHVPTELVQSLVSAWMLMQGGGGGGGF